jgi:hypothetical protein
MAQPNSIFVSPSTTLVQVETLQNPYTPVLLNSVSFPGQVVTVLNTLSSSQILGTSIVVSTVANTFLLQFGRSSISTLIEQPQGYVTVQSKLPNLWNFLNSYPFRDQYISAATQIVTASTLYADIVSTQVDRTSSLQVENLIVSGQFFQSSGLVLNTNVSSLGAVVLLSSLTVLGNTYFSSAVSSIGYTRFASTLSVGKDFVSLSSFQFQSSVTISTSLSALGFLTVASTLQLEGGLIGNHLEVQGTTGLVAELAGGLRIGGIASFSNSVSVGGGLDLSLTTIQGSLSSLSSVSVQESAFVSQGAFIQGSVVVTSSARFLSSVSVRQDLHVLESLRGESNMTIQESLQTLDVLSTQSLVAIDGNVLGNAFVRSLNGLSVPTLQITGSLGFQNLVADSLVIGRNLSTTADFIARNEMILQPTLFVRGSMSTLSTLFVDNDGSVLGSTSIRDSLLFNDFLRINGNVTVLSTTQVSSFSTIVEGNLNVLDSVFVTNLAQLSSISLPQNAIAFNFEADSLLVGNQGIVSSVQISTMYTSSLTTGNLLAAAYTMDMTNDLQVPTFYSKTINASSFQTVNTAEGVFQATTAFTLGLPPMPNTVQINTTAYTLSNTYVDKVLSTLAISSSVFRGTFSGDATGLVDVNYPERISTLYVSTGSLLVERAIISTALFSSGVVTDVFTTYSTLQVGDFQLYGNADKLATLNLEVLPQNAMAAYSDAPTILSLNNMNIQGDTANNLTPQVIINPSILPSLDKTYNLGVGGVLRVNQLISPNLLLEIDTYSGNILVANNIGLYSTNTIYVSSGVIGPNGPGAFFIPQGYTPSLLSTNIIQPVQSTLAFNSTLFVDRLSGKVGINTTPTYTLDVKSNAFVYSQVISMESTLITNQVRMNPSTINVWLAASANGVLTSSDGEQWAPSPIDNPYSFFSPYGVAYDGGSLQLTTSNTVANQRTYVLTTQSNVQVYTEGSFPQWMLAFPVESGTFPQTCRSVAYNGFLWVMTGTYDGVSFGRTPVTLFWSSNAFQWYDAIQGGFLPKTSDPSIPATGGFGVTWNGSLWIAAGQGDSTVNSLLYSTDGKNWYSAQSGGFESGGNAAIWTGSRWIATGNNGLQSSFMVSEDGMNWSGIDGFGFASARQYARRGASVETNGQIVVATGSYDSTVPSAKSIQYSLDNGRTWSNAVGTLFDTDGASGNAVVWNGTYWIASGSTGIRKSTDGITWTQPGSSPAYEVRGMAYSSNATPVAQIGALKYLSSVTTVYTSFSVAAGTQSASPNICLKYSQNGTTWSDALSGYFTTQARGVTYDGSNFWVAAGSGTMANFIYSSDGKNWSNGSLLDPIGLFAVGTSVTFGGNFCIGTLDLAGDAGNTTVWYSSKGDIWNSAPAFSIAGYGAAYDGAGNWIAVGEDASPGTTILFSSDADITTWRSTGITNAFTTRGNGITYGNGQWVAVGADGTGSNIKYSSDGLTWQNATGAIFGTAGFGVEYDGIGTWVAVGQGNPTSSNILYSSDGHTWSNISSGDFAVGGQGIRYNRGTNMWIATGINGDSVTIKYSYNATDWFNATGGFDSIGYGVATTSNAMIYTSTVVNQLRVFQSPGTNVTTRLPVANLAYTASTLTVNDTLRIDNSRNITIQTLTAVSTLSSLIVSNITKISTFTSTGVIQAGGFFLSFATV